MKILCLSDLHIQDEPDLTLQYNYIKSIEDKYDIVVLSGDNFETRITLNIVNCLRLISQNKPVVFCLGNHEFFYRSYEDTIKYYTELQKELDKFDIHCLDIKKSVIFDNINFIGNALMYDGSMIDIPEQRIIDWANNRWADRLIKKWKREWLVQNICNIISIESNIKNDKINILVTHTVPHERLNMHPNYSVFNAYSGVKNLLEKYEFDYSISGHTHKRTIGQIINGCKCINVGSDYDYPLHYILEV